MLDHHPNILEKVDVSKLVAAAENKKNIPMFSSESPRPRCSIIRQQVKVGSLV
jgi:hypothetical protein